MSWNGVLIGMADIQGKTDFWKDVKDGLEFMRLGEKLGWGKHVFNTEGQPEAD